MREEETIPNKLLKQARRLKGLTQSELAEDLGTNFETVSRWERGVITPSLYYQKKLAEVLEKTAEELGLLTGHNEEYLPPVLPGVAFVTSYVDRNHELFFQLKAELQLRDIQVISNHSFRKLEGEQKRKRIQDVFQATLFVVLFVSPQTHASRQVRDSLLVAKMYKRSIYALWIAGECWQQCLPAGYEDLPCTYDVRANCDIKKIITDLEEGHLTSQAIQPSLASSDLPDPRNPYKGLKAFRNKDRDDFFGRNQFITELVEALQAALVTEQSNRLLAIVGPSGSGKSSVVLAGLVPQLQSGALSGSNEWIYLEPMIPGQNPLESLAQTLAMLLPQRSLQTLREDLEEDSSRGLHLLASMMIRPSGAKVLLCVDQFEEVFTQTSSEEEREQFLEVLVTAITEPYGPVVLILTMRSDFDDRPMFYPHLSTVMEARRQPVLPMKLNELQMTIEKPATHSDVQLIFEGTLVSDLLFDVYGQEGALPLLQFTLDLLFQKRCGHLLTQQVYKEIGGVKGALAKHAEDIYRALPSEEHRRLARVLFLRLIYPGATEQDTTRRRATLPEFTLTNTFLTCLIRETIDAFIEARLLTAATVAEIATIEVSHEAVIREWKRLYEWLAEAREDIPLQQAISEDAIAWEQRKRPMDRLYRGTQLTEALAWRDRSLLSQNEETFLLASAAFAQQQHKRYTRRIVLLGLAGVGLAAITTTVSRELFLRNETPPLPLPLPYSYQAHAGVVESVAWSPDNQYLASANFDKTVQVWNASSGRSLLSYRRHTNVVLCVAWSPDGTRLASGGLDKTVQVWDASSGHPLLSYHGHSNTVASVAWSPDGTRLASASLDETVQVWNASNGHMLHIYRGHTSDVNCVVWSPDGTHLASASQDETVRVWDTNSGHPLLIYRGHISSVDSVAWSPDGTRLASASSDRTVQVWDASTGSTLLSYRNHTDTVCSVVWSPDGTHLASASFDETVQVWDASSRHTLRLYHGHTDIVTSIAWSPDGTRLASASFDRTVQVWDASIVRGDILLSYHGHTDNVSSVAWSPNKMQLASASSDRTVQIWDASSGGILFTYHGHTDVVTNVAWSPDGTRLASASSDRTVQVWGGGHIPLTYHGHTQTVTSIAWSPDGTRLASASQDTTVQIWDARNGHTLLIYRGHIAPVNSVAWSPDGTHLASASSDKTVQVWDANNGHILLTYHGHTEAVASITWSPDGKYLASGGLDTTVRVWNASNGHTLLIYGGHIALVNSVTWSPDGWYLASADYNKTVQVWLWIVS